MSNILQHNIERFGMVTVMDVVLYDINADGSQGAPKLFLDTLKMTNINTEGQNKEIRGGIGNDMLISYDFGRTANVEIQDALLSPQSLSVLWGQNGGPEAVKEINHNQIVRVGDTVNYGTIKAGSVYVYPLNGSSATVEGGNAAGTISTDSRVVWVELIASTTIPGQEQTFIVLEENNIDQLIQLPGTAISVQSVKDIADDDIAFVFDLGNKTVYIDELALDGAAAGTATITYTIATSDFKEVKLTNNNFPVAMKLVGQSFVIEESTGKKKKIQIEIPKFKINSNFSFTMDAEGEASVFDFNGVALSQGGELIKIQFLGAY